MTCMMHDRINTHISLSQDGGSVHVVPRKLAERPRSFMCYCGDMNTETRVCTESCRWRRKFSLSSCWDLNPGPFNHEPNALTTKPSLVCVCVGVVVVVDSVAGSDTEGTRLHEHIGYVNGAYAYGKTQMWSDSLFGCKFLSGWFWWYLWPRIGLKMPQ